MKLSGDVHLPEDEDDLQVETVTSGGNGAADGDGPQQRSAARVHEADVVTADDDDQGRLSLSPARWTTPPPFRRAAERAGALPAQHAPRGCPFPYTDQPARDPRRNGPARPGLEEDAGHPLACSAVCRLLAR